MSPSRFVNVCGWVGMFEIPEPPSDHRGQVINDGAHTLASRAFCLLAYLVFEAFETFVSYPAPSCLEAVAQL